MEAPGHLEKYEIRSEINFLSSMKMIITFQQIGVPGAEDLAYKEAHAVV